MSSLCGNRDVDWQAHTSPRDGRVRPVFLCAKEIRMNPFLLFVPKQPTALQLAVRELEDAQRLKLHHASQREYHSAVEDMLVHRAERLRREIVDLSSDQGA